MWRFQYIKELNWKPIVLTNKVGVTAAKGTPTSISDKSRESINVTELTHEAVKQGVAYVLGETFFTDGTGPNTIRLSYLVATPEEIETGTSRLGQVFAGSTATHLRSRFSSRNLESVSPSTR